MSEACAADLGAFVPCGCRRGASFHWLCVRTAFSAEIVADQALRAMGFCTWLPLHLSRERLRPLFPRYLFVQADLGADLWRGIYRCRGVDTILGTRLERPACVPAAALQALWSLCAADGVMSPEQEPHPAALIPEGAAVVLTAGPMTDLRGICRWSNARRVRLLVEIMGRGVAITVPREHVVQAV
jgi:transcription antitermination factor NusG